MAKKTAIDQPKRPLRLEWIQAGSLKGNPHNWRRHPEGQLSALKDVIGDKEVGWAGALLWNERTQRLIDGHGRMKAVGPEEFVPVLVGDWTEAAEKKILLTLDPLAGMAAADPEQLKALMGDVSLSGEALAGLTASLESTLAALALPATAPGSAPTEEGSEGGSGGGGGVGLGTPVVQYAIIFDDEQQQRRWFNFLRYLKKRYPEPETLAARLDLYLEAVDLTRSWPASRNSSTSTC